MQLTDQILAHPVASLALTVGLVVAVAYLRKVRPRQAIAYERIRTVAQPLLDWVLHSPPVDRFARRFLGGPIRRITREKALPDLHDGDNEFIRTVNMSLLSLAKTLWDIGYRWNPISTKKYRVLEDGSRQYAILSVALRDGILDETQHHVYIFRGLDGGLDIYGHQEASVTDVDDHDGGDELVAGDPAVRLRGTLTQAEVTPEN